MQKFVLIVMVLLLGGCAAPKSETVQTEKETEAETESAERLFFEKSFLENLPNDKKGWGMRRNAPERPEFTAEQKEMTEKYGCIYMGTNEKKYLYLTFDEGYENGQTEKILDVLAEKNVRAAFFVTGDYLKKEKPLVDRMVAEGHIVGNHTMNHPCVPKLDKTQQIEDEILSLDRAFYEAYGKHMKYLRLPEGAYSERVLAVTQNLGYTNVFWSFAYDDWYTDKQRGADYAYEKTMNNLHSGCVLLLHAVSRDNAEALGRIISSAREAGYEFLSLDEYIG